LKENKKSRPRRGGEPNSFIDQFIQYDFLSALMDAIHSGYENGVLPDNYGMQRSKYK